MKNPISLDLLLLKHMAMKSHDSMFTVCLILHTKTSCFWQDGNCYLCIDIMHSHIINDAGLLLQLMELLQLWETNHFETSITNNFLGSDVDMSEVSIKGNKLMGFNTQSLTQDVLQGLFTISTTSPIPIVAYSIRFM